MCGLREGDFGDRGHDHAPQPLAPEDLVDGRSHLTPADIDYGEDENAPRFDHPPALYAVRLGESPAIAAVTR